MRVMCWNMNSKDAGWELVREISPDVALLSEVRSIPDDVIADFSVAHRTAVKKSRQPQKFSTALLVRGELTETRLDSEWDWVNEEIEALSGNFVGGSAVVGGRELNVISVYSPPWSIMNRAQLAAIDAADEVKLENNPELWGTELLWAALRNVDLTKPWIVGGDLNTCETFDLWASKPRGNREFLDRMGSLGFTEVLRESQGRLTPTYLNFKTKEVRNQIDHIFVTEPLAELLVECDVGDADRIFGRGLSDHLPVVADFREKVV